MGFDPMTHRPRTDIFSSLPNLIALANLKELIDHHSLEEHALRLQTEAAQMAKLQYLQYLFPPQPPASSNIATGSNQINNIGAFSDMEAFNLLNSLASLKDSPSVSSLSQLDLSASSLQGIK
ncbi:TRANSCRIPTION FACTOR MYB39-LIKE [Salix viminalis]|uniref:TRANSCRIPTION FACTOR MYB39-LIKE n=1 Tax=Salix viminalis TaxID=40686 RepID=A0A9Q0NXY1_SALVM|nr:TRANSCRIPTION FACTOR MYB39-LIKE [Salix viminalis]